MFGINSLTTIHWYDSTYCTISSFLWAYLNAEINCMSKELFLFFCQCCCRIHLCDPLWTKSRALCLTSSKWMLAESDSLAEQNKGETKCTFLFSFSGLGAGDEPNNRRVVGHSFRPMVAVWPLEGESAWRSTGVIITQQVMQLATSPTRPY